MYEALDDRIKHRTCQNLGFIVPEPWQSIFLKANPNWDSGLGDVDPRDSFPFYLLRPGFGYHEGSEVCSVENVHEFHLYSNPTFAFEGTRQDPPQYIFDWLQEQEKIQKRNEVVAREEFPVADLNRFLKEEKVFFDSLGYDKNDIEKFKEQCVDKFKSKLAQKARASLS